ncbi:MAG: type II secretion system major pseudopilin GspG [Acidiphilium sp.]|nr:type II secretion system major pseudopilin GspG [Acidiphilium sp.]MDD4935618.1 type II secretion system major pseudopilin GspG [Acidiphilium sp.]
MNQRTETLPQDDGYTLLELLVVIVILGLLIGLVAPALLSQLGRAKTSIAAQSIEQIGSVLDLYKLDIGRYPSTDQGLEALITDPSGVADWHGPYLKQTKIPLDPWGHPYLYQMPSGRPGLAYDLCSEGSAGQPAGQPDVVGAPGTICNH